MAASTWFCSDRSREAGEPLVATVPRTDVWFMLEYSGAWGNKALQESTIPDSVKSYLNRAEEQIPNTRTELIKQEGRKDTGSFTFMVAVTSRPGSPFWRFSLRSYEDLLDIDLVQLAGGNGSSWAQAVNEPTFLVCTNGKRDQCCAKFGVVAYHLIRQQLGNRAWQCTHLGGHRFAPNIISLPRGIYYGRATAQDIPAIIDSTRIHLPCYRGRAHYEPAAQAAEFFLRSELNRIDEPALILERFEVVSDSRWNIWFSGSAGVQRVEVMREPAGYDIYESCGAETPVPANIFRLVTIEQEA